MLSICISINYGLVLHYDHCGGVGWVGCSITAAVLQKGYDKQKKGVSRPEFANAFLLSAFYI
jgi:hypothetical protein